MAIVDLHADASNPCRFALTFRAASIFRIPLAIPALGCYLITNESWASHSTGPGLCCIRRVI